MPDDARAGISQEARHTVLSRRNLEAKRDEINAYKSTYSCGKHHRDTISNRRRHADQRYREGLAIFKTSHEG